ncbi:uncharacterized protein BO96DRAFT_434815 [Aspergillus niger CBS 101883]|uniref:uncharacterized protein n=1 Tax=Aspergillus lacticoffeatus (strain CBS 101883) TaxID=1450533 RepID=UPI000D7EBF3C|nr:uncharacterized protein BO96DRAFT_434815 [Aspergillus niger CBS 101883]PYH55900.1 hypothetical protein BO96DRAFT_434815 [Aspergillus niger CBS 101883]
MATEGEVEIERRRGGGEKILSRPEIISINLDHRGTDKYERYCAASLRPYHRDDQFPSAFFLCLSGFATEFSIRQPDPLLTEDLPGDFLCYTVLDFPSGIFPWSTKLHIYSNSTMSLFGQCPQGRAHNPSSRTVPIYQNKRSPALFLGLGHEFTPPSCRWWYDYNAKSPRYTGLHDPLGAIIPGGRRMSLVNTPARVLRLINQSFHHCPEKSGKQSTIKASPYPSITKRTDSPSHSMIRNTGTSRREPLRTRYPALTAHEEANAGPDESRTIMELPDTPTCIERAEDAAD